MNFYKSLLILLVAFSLTKAFAGREGGGGDPVAIDFATTLIKVTMFLEQNANLAPGLDLPLVKEVTVSLYKSLNVVGKSLIEVVELRPKDPFGVEKAAVFLTNPTEIQLHRETWENSSPSNKVTLATMEVLGLGNLKEKRYEIANFIGSMYYQQISALEIDPKEGTTILILDARSVQKKVAKFSQKFTLDGSVMVKVFVSHMDTRSDTGRVAKLGPAIWFKEKVTVKGLQLEGEDLVFHSLSGPVICGTVGKKKYFNKILTNGNCTLTSKIVQINGKGRLHTYLNVKNKTNNN